MIETRGQWVRVGDSWIDAAEVVCVERHDEDGRTLVGLSSGACADCEVEPGEILEAVHRARRFARADLRELPPTKTSAAAAWRALVKPKDRDAIVATLRAGADKAEAGTANALRLAALVLEELDL